MDTTTLGSSVLELVRESNAKAQFHIKAVGEILATAHCPQARDCVAPHQPSIYQQLAAATTALQELGTQMMTGMDAAEQGLAYAEQQLETSALHWASAVGHLEFVFSQLPVANCQPERELTPTTHRA